MKPVKTLEDDMNDFERNAQQIELLKVTNPKVERIRARRDIKVARAAAETTDTKIARYIAAAVAVAILSVAGCSAVVFSKPDTPPVPNTPEKDAQIHEEKMTCIKAKGTWYHDACDF